MQKLILKKSVKFEKYLIDNCEGHTIHYLGNAITDFQLRDYQDYFDWALNPKEDYMGFNVAELEKEKDYILIGSELSEQDDGGPFFKISIHEFLKLLPIWKKLVEVDSEFITIVENDGILDITGN